MAAVIVVEQSDDMLVYAMVTMRAANSFVERSRQTLADKKTEAILTTYRRKKNTAKVDVGGYRVVSRLSNTWG